VSFPFPVITCFSWSFRRWVRRRHSLKSKHLVVNSCDTQSWTSLGCAEAMRMARLNVTIQ
jgi:hypothetical protein